MKITEVMTVDPFCCVISETAQKAALVMRELSVGIIPVIESEESMRLVGVVTDRDLCMEVVAEGLDPTEVFLDECMTIKVITCSPDDDLNNVLNLMRHYQIRRIPVIDEQQRILGIVSTADIILSGGIDANNIDEALRDISEPNVEELEHLAELQGLGTMGDTIWQTGSGPESQSSRGA